MIRPDTDCPIAIVRFPGTSGVPSDHDSDDDSGGKCNARLVVTFTQAAPYEIDVNTQGRKFATGAFVLSVTSGAKPKSDTPCHPG